MTDAQAKAAFETRCEQMRRGWPARMCTGFVAWEDLPGQVRKEWYEVVQAVLDATA